MKKLRTTIDLLLIFVLPVLMGYSLVSELYHEIIGISIGVLFAVHILLNRKWFVLLFRDRLSINRVVTLIVNVLHIICVLTSMVSGIFLSKYVFSFLGITVLSSLMRILHMLAAYWGLVLMSFHAGTHGKMLISKLKKKPVKYAVSAGLLMVAVYGVYAFIRRGFADFLFGKVMFVFFDFSEPYIFYYLDYLAVMILFTVLGFLTTRLLTKPVNRKRKNIDIRS